MPYLYSQQSLHRSEANRMQARRAALAGDVDAQIKLAEYLKYWVDPVDWKDVRDLLLMAAAQKNPTAFAYLGTMYCLGQGCNKDWEKALSYFLACEGEDVPNAQFQLGYMYYHGGNGLHQDRAKALEYFQLSLKGNAEEITYFEDCNYYLGLLYSAGDIVSIDRFKSCVFLGIAAHPWSLDQLPADPADYRPPVCPELPEKELNFFFDVNGEKVYVLGGKEFSTASTLLTVDELNQVKDKISRCIEAREVAVLEFMNS